MAVIQSPIVIAVHAAHSAVALAAPADVPKPLQVEELRRQAPERKLGVPRNGQGTQSVAEVENLLEAARVRYIGLKAGYRENALAR